MKFGMRKPSIMKSIKARTTGKLKRKIKRAINPFYGKRGNGLYKKPETSSKKLDLSPRDVQHMGFIQDSQKEKTAIARPGNGHIVERCSRLCYCHYTGKGHYWSI